MSRKQIKQKELSLPEFLSLIMAEQKLSVRRLAKKVSLSPTIVQAMRSGSKKDFNLKSFFKILGGIDCTKLTAEVDGQQINIKIDP